MLQQDTIESPPVRSVKMVDSNMVAAKESLGESRESSLKCPPEIHELSANGSQGSSFVVLTKGNDDYGVGNGDHCDTKTVSTDGDSCTRYSHQMRLDISTQCSGLDWSFLREGELFDRQEQQQRLLDAFHRHMVMANTENKSGSESIDGDNNGRDQNNESEERSQSFRRSIRLSGCTFSARTKELVLVSGLSGTGKTILVEETLKGPVEERGGYFLCGKLDQLNKGNSSPQRPYAPFAMAFSTLVDSVLTNSDVAEEIRAAVSSNMTNRDIDIIVASFPSLARLLFPEGNGSDAVVSKNKINSADNQMHLARVVRIFLETICDPQKRPIVLLIDDLQWADQGTLVLLKALLSENEDDRNTSTNGLLVVGTCRHNEVTVEDDLAELLRSLEDEENVTICQIEVFNLSRPVCGELFARVLGVPSENSTVDLASSLDPLVDIAYEQTKGNAFFLLQFIRSLHDEGYLHVQAQKEAPSKSASKKFQMDDDTINTSETSTLDNSTKPYEPLHQQECKKQQSKNWLWSEVAIRSSRLHDTASVQQDAISILTHQMKRFPPEVQQTLSVASCLGSGFEKRVLQMAMPTSSGEKCIYSDEILSNSLELLVEQDFLRSNNGGRHFRFRHDKIQQAAIALVDDNDRAAFCTNIGRRVLEHAGTWRSEIIFLIVNFFSHGVSGGIITDRTERMVVASLAMEAGEMATAMSDFTTAATYFNLGITCLQSNYVGIKYGYWKEEYDFSLSIFSAAAEVEKCVANFERMDSLIREILQNARTFYDKMNAYITMINSLGTRERLFEAIAQGFSLLEVVGERFHTKDLKIFLLADLIKTKRMLKKFDGDLDRWPKMKDKDKLAAMEILNLIFAYCLMLNHPKAPHAIFRMVQLTVKYGICANSAPGFVAYGMGMCALGDFLSGNRYGKIALRIQDHFGSRYLTSRVHCMYFGWVSNWNRPLAMNLEPIMDAHRAGLSGGDIEFSGVAASIYATNSFHAGRSLNIIDTEVTRLQELLILFRQTAAISVISPILQQVYNLREGNRLCTVPWVLTGNACVEETLMAEAKASNNVMCLSQFYFRKLWMAYVFNNYEYALAMADESREAINCSKSSFIVYSHYFFEGMTCMALARSSDTKLKEKKFVRRAKRCLKIMKKFNNHCKRNCLNKFLILEAEFLIMKGDLIGGLTIFDEAASVSQEEGFMHEQAIAYERAGLAVLYLTAPTNNNPQITSNIEYSRIANNYFSKAISSYQNWGARTKVDQMVANGYKPD